MFGQFPDSHVPRDLMLPEQPPSYGLTVFEKWLQVDAVEKLQFFAKIDEGPPLNVDRREVNDQSRQVAYLCNHPSAQERTGKSQSIEVPSFLHDTFLEAAFQCPLSGSSRKAADVRNWADPTRSQATDEGAFDQSKRRSRVGA